MTHPQEPTRDRNLDPITEAPGAHPLGTAVGAVVCGLAGKGAAEAVNPTDEDAYWCDAHGREPYYSDAYTYEDYAPP